VSNLLQRFNFKTKHETILPLSLDNKNIFQIKVRLLNKEPMASKIEILIIKEAY